jgi:hypothetical protein
MKAHTEQDVVDDCLPGVIHAARGNNLNDIELVVVGTNVGLVQHAIKGLIAGGVDLGYTREMTSSIYLQNITENKDFQQSNK